MARVDRLDPDHNLWHWLSVDLRVWREERNLSQVDVAQICGVDNSTVSNWESGSAKIPQRHTETLDRVWRTRGHFTRLRGLADSSHDPNWLCDVKSHVSSECMIGGRWKVGMHSRLVPEPVPAVTCVLAS
ncbi:helix-turn-helix domain-containing protein [Actinomadura luteofluorescens]|uniref:helix-turn-helix domain-containing protein n=1 Tax=Actinomadura luteofluorescens TaxID=46163 RepID=UPI003BAFF55D